jgi:hypothetical protein
VSCGVQVALDIGEPAEPGDHEPVGAGVRELAARLFSEEGLGKAGLPDHRCQRSRGNLIIRIVKSDIDKVHTSIDDSAVTSMARGSVPVQHEAAPLDDRDEFAEGALQLWQAMGSQTAESLTEVLP